LSSGLSSFAADKIVTFYFQFSEFICKKQLKSINKVQVIGLLCRFLLSSIFMTYRENYIIYMLNEEVTHGKKA